MVRFVLFLSLFMSFLPSTANAQQPPMSFEKRIELAKKLIAEDRAAAIAAPSNSERTTIFTVTNALIEPKWTADFILDNPIKGQAEAAYENTTIINLLNHPEELTEEQILQLVDFYPFLSSNYIYTALENLPDDPKHDALKKKLVQKAIDAIKKTPPVGHIFGISIPSYSTYLPEDPEFEQGVKKKIHEFFVSGEAEKTWNSVSKGQGADAYHIARLKKMAPDGFDLSFLGKQGSNSIAHGFELMQVLQDQSLSEEEKSNWLATKHKVVFGTEPHEAKASATSIGLVAKFDMDKALAWSETAKSPVVKIFAQLSIAPVLARKDKPAAIELVRKCYDNCANLDPRTPANRGDLVLLNTWPIEIATTGLRIAKHIDTDLLDECVKTTFDMIKIEMERTQGYAGQFNRVLAVIARYDRKGAKAIFDKQTEVQLGYASEFFVALVAIDPDSVWEEYETLPQDTEDPIKPRFRTRQAIVEALVQRDEDDFWAKLERYHYVDFPKSIFEP